jgi:hypothetical protein
VAYRNIQVIESVYKLVCEKRDEYLRINEYTTSCIGKYASLQKVVEYAVELLNWMDRNQEDEHVQSIMMRFEMKSRVNKPGKPHSKTKRVNAIPNPEMDKIMNHFRAQGIYSPSTDQILEVWDTEGFKEVRENHYKSKRENTEKMNDARTDPSVAKLDEVTRKIQAEKPTQNYEGRIWNKQGTKYKPPT